MMTITIHWLNLGILVATGVCWGLALGGITGLFKGEDHLLLAGLCMLIGSFIGFIVGLIWPIVRLCVS